MTDENTRDDDPANMLLRAGYLQGLASRLLLAGDDREMIARASRSLIYAATIAEEATIAKASVRTEVFEERATEIRRLQAVATAARGVSEATKFNYEIGRHVLNEDGSTLIGRLARTLSDLDGVTVPNDERVT